MATTDLAPSAVPAEAEALRLPAAFRLPRALTEGGGRSIALAWVASRSLTLSLMLVIETTVGGDVNYYARSLGLLFHGSGVRETLQEYPLPVLGILLPQYLLGGMDPARFALLFAGSMLAIDAAFVALLYRNGGRRQSEAVRLWLWFVPLIGPTAYFRFDLVPAAIAGAAVLAAVRRPGLTGVLTAVGAALKLWPVALLPTFLVRRGNRAHMLKAFAATSAAIVAACLAIGGPARLLSPLRWQSERGLQIESIPAMPLLFANSLPLNHRWTMKISIFNAWEIYGPGVSEMLLLSTALTVGGFALLAVLWWRARIMPSVSAPTLGWLVLATAAVLTVVNKTLSPQYILWLGGPVAALLIMTPRDAAVRRVARLLLATAALTQVVYPIWYNSVTYQDSYTFPATSVLIIRNLMVIWLTGIACVEVWRRTRPAEADSPARRRLVQTGR